MSKFEELMANMAKTRMMPIDRQPISPMPPEKYRREKARRAQQAAARRAAFRVVGGDDTETESGPGS